MNNVKGGEVGMTNEAAVKWLKNLKQDIGQLRHEDLWPYAQAIDEIMELLEEQEALEPIYIENPYTHLPVSYCPKCREPIDQYITWNPYRKTKYCHYCGQKVKWE